MKWFSLLCSFLLGSCIGFSSPFDYELNLHVIPGTNSRTMICFHGSGANYHIADYLKAMGVKSTLVSFNFPDHDIDMHRFDVNKTTFGTMAELLPAFYVLKKFVLEKNLKEIDLYGFSAGGAVVVNLIATLNTSFYDSELKRLGIDKQEKDKMLQAIQKGIVILDAPLKSVEEIIDFRGFSPEMQLLAKRYLDNHMRPIDALNSLKGLSLNIILYFENPDEILSNRDDQLYIERIKAVNDRGHTEVLIGNAGGHLASHMLIWKMYAHMTSSFEKS